MHRPFPLQRDIVGLVLLPLLTFVILWRGGKGLEATWLATLGAWLLTVSFWREARRARVDVPSIPWILWCPAVGTVVWAAITYATSATANYGYDEVLRDGAYAAVFLWVTRSAARETSNAMTLRIVRVLAAATLIACAIGVAVYTLQPVNRFVGTFFDHRFHTDYWPNAWAEYLLLAWPFFLIIPFRDGRGGWVRRIAVGLVLGCLLLSYSRGAMIAFAGQLVLLVIVLLQTSRDAWRRVAREAVTIALIALAIFGTVNLLRGRSFDVQDVAEKVTFAAAEGTSSVSERAQFWSQAWTMFTERPWTGWGPYSFRFVQPTYQSGVLATSDHPHNVILKFLAERGWPAAALFLLFIIGLMYGVIPFFLRKHLAPSDQSLLTVAAIAVAGTLAHNLIDFNLQFVGIGLPLAIVCGLLAGYIARHQSIYPLWMRKKMNKKIILYSELFLTSLVVIAAVVETPPMILSSLGRHAEAAGDPAQALLWYDAAKGQVFSRDLHLSRTNLLIKEKRFDEASVALHEYFEQNAEDPRAWTLKTQLLAAQGDSSGELLQAADEAYRRNRFNDIRVLPLYIEAARSGGISLESRRTEFDELFQAYADAMDRNTHFIILGPNADAFESAAEALSTLYPDGEPGYQIVAARVQRKMERERAMYAERASGWLW